MFFHFITKSPGNFNSLPTLQGFGAGNFKALFESIELEQNERGNLFYTDVKKGSNGVAK